MPPGSKVIASAATPEQPSASIYKALPASMVERVARAIFNANFHTDEDGETLVAKWEEWPEDRARAMRHARAAIAAMREPTEAMEMAAFHAFKSKARGKFDNNHGAHLADIAMEGWQAMIDEALKDTP